MARDDDLGARVGKVLAEMEKDLTPVVFVSADGSCCTIQGETNAVTALTDILQQMGERSGNAVIVWRERSNFSLVERPTHIVEAPNLKVARELLTNWHDKLSASTQSRK